MGVLLGIGLLGMGLFVPVHVAVVFSATEAWIPRDDIRKALKPMRSMRLIQFISWFPLKERVLRQYPMIEQIHLRMVRFPEFSMTVIEKKPWAVIMHDNRMQVCSQDGTLLNAHLDNIELPNGALMMVTTSMDITEGNRVRDRELEILRTIDPVFQALPELMVQQWVITPHSIECILTDGTVITVGDAHKLAQKLTTLHYFVGSFRDQLHRVSAIDIQYDGRVIVH